MGKKVAFDVDWEDDDYDDDILLEHHSKNHNLMVRRRIEDRQLMREIQERCDLSSEDYKALKFD